MRSIGLVGLVVVAVVVLAAASAAALTADEAQQLFQQKGCTSCHNGNLAPDFQGTVEKIKQWAQKYNSLDEAVAAESSSFKMYNDKKTWNDLINAMPGITPELKAFFEQVFQEAKGGAAGGKEGGQGGAAAGPAKTVTVTTTVTQTQVETITKTVTKTEHVTITVTPAGYDQGTAGLIAKAGYVAAIIVAIVVVILAYMMLGRK